MAADQDWTLHCEGGRTIVRDEEGDTVFELPGDVGIPIVQAVERLRSRAYKQGIEDGREAMARDLRRLLGAAPVEQA